METNLPQEVPDDGLDVPASREYSSEASHYSGSKRESFEVETSGDLLNNEVTKAFSKEAIPLPSIIPLTMWQSLNAPDGLVDWTKNKNTERLVSLRKLIRNQFWALESELDSENEVSPTVPEGRIRRAVPKALVRFVRHTCFGGFYLVMTVYALFGPDLCACFGRTPLNEEDLILASINTIVLIAFIFEEILNSLVFEGYICSLRFWIDTLATVSIAGDSLIGTEFLQSDAFVASRGSRLTKILRVGGRSSKFMRFLRMARNVQLTRLVPKLNEWLNRGTTELAFQIWYKRMRHVLTFLDSTDSMCLNEVDIHFFNTAMEVEFPVVAETKSSALFKMWAAVQKIRPPAMERKVVPSSPTSFPDLMEAFYSTATGKRTFQRCKQDINCMKESCAIVEQASDRLTLKVCILVLMLLLTMQLLMSESEDTSRIQGLYQVDVTAMSAEMSPSQFCDFVKNEFTEVLRSSTFLLLVANYRVFWEPGCECCNPDASAAQPALANPLAEGGIVERIVRATGKEAHEIHVEAIFGPGSIARSLVVFDNHELERAMAANSLFQTFIVVILLTALVLYFALDVRKMASRNVLHPLWNLMDDMCSLKNIDILLLGQKSGSIAIFDDFQNQMYKKYFQSSSSKVTMVCRCKSGIVVSDELLQLRTAFDKLHMAMQSWSKYVPLILLKQLFEANVEASIGCSFVEVSVVFIAISDFETVCEHLSSQQVLDLMSGVLSGIHEALDSNGGTMLEFIGDEVLAIFNAPARVAGFESNAIAAALEAQELVAKLGHSNVSLKASVHKARVLAGNLGSPTRMKYGVLGDGVNLSARLKSLNTRYDTQLLVSYEALDFPGCEETYLTRPVGDLILKGRNTPTRTFEVLAKRDNANPKHLHGAQKHKQAFELFKKRWFAEAKKLFEEVHDLMGHRSHGVGDKVAMHFVQLCQSFMDTPPPDSWDGSEKLVKKAF